MSGILLSLLTLCSALGAALMAGAFFAFSAFVMKALARLPTAQGIAAMQSINVAVIHPVFLSVFLGTPALCAVLGVSSLFQWQRPGSALLLAGCLLYFFGTFLVTMRFNVPRNEALAAVDPDSADGALLWKDYLVRWTAWNHVRTVAALAATALLMLALLFLDRAN